MKSIFFLILFWIPAIALAQNDSLIKKATDAPLTPALEKILTGIENRYSGSGFSADFYQESTIQAMAITDTAKGTLLIKRPGMMRWEYQDPEIQIIITNGIKLWVYRPQDHQVMIGKAPEFFGDGNGAGFLANIRQVRQNFQIFPGNKGNAKHYSLKLVPFKPSMELMEIYLTVVKETFELIQIFTYNAYKDETRIDLSHFQYNLEPDNALFTFIIPENTDVLIMEP